MSNMLYGDAPSHITIPADQGDTGSSDPAEQIQAGLDMIRAALAADGLSEQERLILEKVTTLIQQIPANREKEQQAAMGSSPAMNYLRRTSGG